MTVSVAFWNVGCAKFESDRIFVLVRSRQRGLDPNVSLAYPFIEGRDRDGRTQIHKILNALI
jgi:hypothetical protein